MDSWRTISSDGNTVTLTRFKGLDLRAFSPEELGDIEVKIGCAVDVETTGLGRHVDSIIEIGLQVFFFDAETGSIIGRGESFRQLQDPGKPISEVISRVTGIRYNELKGEHIEWNEVARIIDSSHLIIAHNATFDRSFVDRYVSYSSRPVWSCTVQQIDWLKYGFTSANLQLLAAFHGFFSNSHRALEDAQMLVHLLAQDKRYLLELYQNAHSPRVVLKLLNTPYESRSILREYGYRWSPTEKAWSRSLLKNELGVMLGRLSQVYFGKEPQYEIIDIPLSENFKF